MKPSHGEWEMGSWCKPGWRKHQNVLNWISEIYLSLFFPSINSLQVELNNIFMLRKQLEEDVLGNRNLQKILQDQIKDMKNHKGLYPCPAQPSSCTKEKWFYYSHFAGMEKKYLRVKKGVKRFFFLLFLLQMIWWICNRMSWSNQGTYRGTVSLSMQQMFEILWQFYCRDHFMLPAALYPHNLLFPQKSQICFPQ